MTVNNKTLVGILTLVLFLFSANAAYAAPTIDEQLTRLDGSLSALSGDMDSARHILGWTSLCLSVVPVLYYWMLIQSSSTDLDLLFIGSSAALAGGGLALLLIPSAAEGGYRQFSARPRETEEDRTALITLGENMLSGLAAGGTVGRIIGGTISLAEYEWRAYREWKAGTNTTAMRVSGPRVAMIPNMLGLRMRVML